MNTIYLDPRMVPAHLRGSYTGKMFKAEVCTSVTIPSDAGLWDGGSRHHYHGVDLNTGETRSFPGQNSSPWNTERKTTVVQLEPGFAVVEHSIFCGKDMGLRFYVHPDNAAKLLPAPVELDHAQRCVLVATAHFKASYQGMDRYQMAMREARFDGYPRGSRETFPTREQWDAAKAALITRGLLNKAGAITPAGRNAAR